MPNWEHHDGHITRALELDDSQHAQLVEQIRIVADTFGLNPTLDRRNGLTHVSLCADQPDGDSLITFAGRIESAYIAVVGDEIARARQPRPHWWARLKVQLNGKKRAARTGASG